jgi:hypothetical protein
MMANWPKYVVQINKNNDMYCVLLKPGNTCFLLIITVVIINRPQVHPTSGSIANFHPSHNRNNHLAFIAHPPPGHGDT